MVDGTYYHQSQQSQNQTQIKSTTPPMTESGACDDAAEKGQIAVVNLDMETAGVHEHDGTMHSSTCSASTAPTVHMHMRRPTMSISDSDTN